MKKSPCCNEGFTYVEFGYFNHQEQKREFKTIIVCANCWKKGKTFLGTKISLNKFKK